jgi:hypothetical protein
MTIYINASIRDKIADLIKDNKQFSYSEITTMLDNLISSASAITTDIVIEIIYMLIVAMKLCDVYQVGKLDKAFEYLNNVAKIYDPQFNLARFIFQNDSYEMIEYACHMFYKGIKNINVYTILEFAKEDILCRLIIDNQYTSQLLTKTIYQLINYSRSERPNMVLEILISNKFVTKQDLLDNIGHFCFFHKCACVSQLTFSDKQCTYADIILEFAKLFEIEIQNYISSYDGSKTNDTLISTLFKKIFVINCSTAFLRLFNFFKLGKKFAKNLLVCNTNVYFNDSIYINRMHKKIPEYYPEKEPMSAIGLFFVSNGIWHRGWNYFSFTVEQKMCLLNYEKNLAPTAKEKIFFARALRDQVYKITIPDSGDIILQYYV